MEAIRIKLIATLCPTTSVEIQYILLRSLTLVTPVQSNVIVISTLSAHLLSLLIKENNWKTKKHDSKPKFNVYTKY